MANGLEGLGPDLWQRVRRVLEPESGTETAGLIGASMMPGVGEAIDIADIAAGIQDRDLGRIGLGAVGLALPFISGRTIRGARDLARAGGTPPAITPPPPSVKGLEALGHSRLEKFFLETQQGKATGSQWLATLKKAPGGIPKGEMEWTGVTSLLGENPSRVFTRAELQKHMDDRGIKLKETWRGHTRNKYSGWDEVTFDTERSLLEEEAHLQRQLGNSAEESRLWGEMDQMTRAQEEMAGFGGPGTPKFGDSNLRIEGPSDNYRELTVQLDDPKSRELQRLGDLRKEIERPFKRQLPRTRSGPLSPEARVKWDAIGEQIKTVKNDPTFHQPFTHSHWDEPNVLVHMRMSDRAGVNPKTGKPEKVLFVEEIQSDWHEKGRKAGYWNQEVDDAITKEIVSAQQALKGLEGKHGMSRSEAILQRDIVQRKGRGLMFYAGRGQGPKRAFDQAVKEKKRLDDIIGEFDGEVENLNLAEARRWGAQQNKIVPGPFKDTDEWVGLGMRRAIQEGVDGGYDRVAWASGEQVATLPANNLRKHVSKIEYDQNIQHLTAWDLEGNQAIHHRNITPDQLPEYLGKERAERLLAQDSAGIVADDYVITELKDSRGLPMFRVEGPYTKTHATSRRVAERMAENFAEDFNSRIRIIEGDDLAIGGDDMIYFYDKIVPNAVKNEGNKLGGIKMERIGLEAHPPLPYNELQSTIPAGLRKKPRLGPRGTNQSFAITPEMRNIVGQSGQRLWGTGGLVGLGLVARQQGNN